MVSGMKRGPCICCMCTTETAKAAQARGASVKTFIDDNGVVGTTQQECYEGQTIMVATATAAGWPISEDKVGLWERRHKILGPGQKVCS